MKVFDKALGIVVLMIVFVLVFGDIGFDKPGKFGLDFGHFLIISAILIICGTALFVRIICYIYKKSAQQDGRPKPPEETW